MKTFITIILVLLLLRWLLKPLIKFTVFTTVNRMAEQARREQQPIRPEGTISVENTSKKSVKKKNSDDGDYVDYEIVN